MSQKSDDLSRHRFFKAMVVMGSGLALGCGGASERDGAPAHGDGGTGSSGGEGSGGSSTGGSAGTGTSSGGTSVGGKGGSGGTATGGAGNGGNAGSGGAMPTPNCPTSQWSSPDYPACGDGNGLVLPANSVCDLSRPTSAEDCDSGQVFACLKASIGVDGIPFPEPKPYGCQCVTDQPSCRDECGELYSTDAQCEEAEDAGSILCGCALIVLK